MNPDGRDGQVPYAPVSRKAGAWTGAIGLIVLLYFMSPMFVAKVFMMSGGFDNRATAKFFDMVYTPAFALADHWKPYKGLLEHELRWLGLDGP